MELTNNNQYKEKMEIKQNILFNLKNTLHVDLHTK